MHIDLLGAIQNHIPYICNFFYPYDRIIFLVNWSSMPLNLYNIEHYNIVLQFI
jgi:hypothetical protein